MPSRGGVIENRTIPSAFVTPRRVTPAPVARTTTPGTRLPKRSRAVSRVTDDRPRCSALGSTVSVRHTLRATGGLSGPMIAAEALVLRPGLRVLYTSGYTANAILHHSRLDAGAELLPKPYRRADLARKVRAALS